MKLVMPITLILGLFLQVGCENNYKSKNGDRTEGDRNSESSDPVTTTIVDSPGSLDPTTTITITNSIGVVTKYIPQTNGIYKVVIVGEPEVK